MNFDLEHGFFRSVGISAAWVAFETLRFDQKIRMATAAFQGLAKFTRSETGRPLITVAPQAIEGSEEYEFALWREVARALDGVEMPKGTPLPSYKDPISGRLSGPVADELCGISALVNRTLTVTFSPVFWIERFPVPHSSAPNEKIGISAVGSIRLAERLERRIKHRVYFRPSEVFANAFAQFVACPIDIQTASPTLAEYFSRVLLRECSVKVTIN